MTGILNLLMGTVRSAVATDPYFEYTTLLLPGNGPNLKNNNEFLDSSANAFTVTRNPLTGPNAPTQGTFSPFSQTGWGNYFDGTGDTLALPSSSNLAVGTGDFCVEAWVYWTTTGVLDAIYSNLLNSGGGDTQLNIQLTTGNKVQVTGWSTTFLTGATSVVSNTWNHIAVCRSGTILSVFLNGSRDATTTSANNWSSTNAFYIGDYPAGGATFSGYISNLRVVKGSTPYDATLSSIPVPTAPLTAISGTSLLTCQSNRFIDNSTNNFTITRNGDTRVVAFSPFNPTASWSAATNGGSGYFDGSGDYLSVPDNAAFDFPGDFTIETWIYLNATGQQHIYEGRVGSTTNSLLFYLNASTQPSVYINGSVVITGSSALTTGQWYHLVASRLSNTVYLFVNGSSAATPVSNSTSITSPGAIYISSNDAGTGSYINGYLSNYRVLKGTGYSSVTVPTAPLTAITNTSLLLNFTNAGIYDATSKNDLETVGNAQISTTQSKFPPSSMLFDGTGDYLVGKMLPYLAFGSGDMTIECWVYPNTISGQDTIFDTRVSGAYGNDAFTFQLASGVLQLFAGSYASGGTAVIAGSSSVSTGVWTHLAISRASGTNRLFVNGSLITSNSNSWNQTFTSTNLYYVGQTIGVDRPFDGYIQDLRITTGYARYTTTFTPPTAAFPTL